MTALRWPAKRALDVLGAAGGLIVLGPLLLLTALAVRRALGSPVLLR
jgi:lipopolysaccharide/colanic/teichoic acid biosynthesis glycosyltransferase